MKKWKFWEPFWSYQLNSTLIQPIYFKTWPNWQCCLVGSSKTAPRILIFSLSWVPHIHFMWNLLLPTYPPKFLGESVLAIVLACIWKLEWVFCIRMVYFQGSLCTHFERFPLLSQTQPIWVGNYDYRCNFLGGQKVVESFNFWFLHVGIFDVHNFSFVSCLSIVRIHNWAKWFMR